MKYLIQCTGKITEILYASSIAKKLKEQDKEHIIDYYTPLPQLYLLLKENPYIHEVYFPGNLPTETYDITINTPTPDSSRSAIIQMQEAAGITNPSDEFIVYTVPKLDDEAFRQLNEATGTKEWKLNVGIVNGWETRFTVPRDAKPIMDNLSSKINLIAVGAPPTISSNDPQLSDPNNFAFLASLLGTFHWVIGTEGGLMTLARGVGTKTLIIDNTSITLSNNELSDYIWNILQQDIP